MAQAVMLLSLLALDPPAAALLPSSKACPRTAAKAMQNGDLMEVNTMKTWGFDHQTWEFHEGKTDFPLKPLKPYDAWEFQRSHFCAFGNLYESSS